jgi:ABC-type polysaccharide/polyol phosphate export permease
VRVREIDKIIEESGSIVELPNEARAAAAQRRIAEPKHEPDTYERKRRTLECLIGLRIEYYDGWMMITGSIPVPSAEKANKTGLENCNIDIHPHASLKFPMARIPGTHFLRNLVERRALLYQLVRRDFQQRFVGSAAGWLWGVIHPLVLLLSWTFVFQVCLKVPLPKGDLTENYTLFLFCGFLPWLLFQETVLRSASSLLDHSNLITKTVFPAEVVPVSVFLSSLIHHVIALALAMGAVAIVLRRVSPMVVFLPVYMFLVGMLAVGLGWIVSSLHVYLRDTAQVITVVMTLWFWMTPIFVSEAQVPERFRFLIRLNPLSFVVRAYRERLLSTAWPNLHELAIVTAYAVTFFVVGGLFFRQLKRGFADVL